MSEIGKESMETAYRELAERLAAGASRGQLEDYIEQLPGLEPDERDALGLWVWVQTCVRRKVVFAPVD